MESAINKLESEFYAKQYADTLVNSKYGSQIRAISGDAIKSFAPCEQVNYFMLKVIFDSWKSEIDVLKASPYFDFNNVEVQASFQIFVNTLSNHILVAPHEVLKLIGESVEQTLSLTFNPYTFFKNLLTFDHYRRISLADIKETARFIRVHKTFYLKFIERLESTKIQNFLSHDITSHFAGFYPENSALLDGTQPIVDQLSGTYPLPIEKILPSIKKGFQKEMEAIEKAVPPTKPMDIRPIKLNLNQRIMFSKQLFGGNEDSLNHTIARLEVAGTLDNANYILSFFKWDKEDEAAIELRELVARAYKS